MTDNLALYKIFHQVAITESISSAAKELFISQPAISKSIKRLEENLDTKLFIRNSRGVTLTEDGKLLYEHTKGAFAILSKGELQLTRHKQEGFGELRIGTSSTLCKYILLPLLQNFITAHPHIKLTIHCQSTFKTTQLLQKGKIDIGLIGKTNLPESFHFSHYYSVRDTFVATPDYLREHNISSDSDTKALQDSTLLLLDEDNISRLYINKYLQNIGTNEIEMIEIGSMDLLIEFAKMGLGIGCVIREFVEQELSENLLAELPFFSDIQSRSIGFAYQNSGINEQSVDAFLSLILSKEKKNESWN